jgi:hypothetical protein
MNMHSQRGQTLPFVGMVLFVLVGMTSLAVDVGYLRYQQRVQQSAADSAALAGAAEVQYSTTSASSAAAADAAKNGFQDGVNDTTVSINPNYSSTYTGTSPAVEVQITKKYPRFFAAVFGNGKDAIATRAVARLTDLNPYCLYQLGTGVAPNFSSMTFNGHYCGIVMNGNANFNSARIDAAVIGYSGDTPATTGATFVEAQPTRSLPAQDPCQRIPGCAYLANNPPSNTNCTQAQGSQGSTVYLNGGCYNGMSLSKSNVVFNPGVYVLSSGSYNFNQATLYGNGVTFYIEDGVQLNFNAVVFNLSPPTTGPTQGVLMYQVPSNTNSVNFNNSGSQVVSGLLYFPSATVNFNGSLGAYTVLVVNNMNFNGSTQSFPSPPPDSSLMQAPALAE